MLIRKAILTIFIITMFAACTGQFYKIPTPPVPAGKYQVAGQDSITATGIMLFGFIPIQQNDKIQRAVEALKQKFNGDYVTDVSIQERWFWAYVLNGYRVEVSGTVLKKK